MESFIIGGLTALVAGLAVMGWRFLARKEISDTALLIRIIIEACILAINVILIFVTIVGAASNMASENPTGLIMGLLLGGIFYGGFCVLFGKYLYRDIDERIRRKNSDSNNDANRDDDDF